MVPPKYCAQFCHYMALAKLSPPTQLTFHRKECCFQRSNKTLPAEKGNNCKPMKKLPLQWH